MIGRLTSYVVLATLVLAIGCVTAGDVPVRSHRYFTHTSICPIPCSR
jgi:hypothetical protein